MLHNDSSMSPRVEGRTPRQLDSMSSIISCHRLHGARPPTQGDNSAEESFVTLKYALIFMMTSGFGASVLARGLINEKSSTPQRFPAAFIIFIQLFMFCPFFFFDFIQGHCRSFMYASVELMTRLTRGSFPKGLEISILFGVSARLCSEDSLYALA